MGILIVGASILKSKGNVEKKQKNYRKSRISFHHFTSRLYIYILLNDTRTQYMCYMRIMIIVFSATLNSISVISWRSVLLVEEMGENHRSASSH
jgi:hypothetical protein